MAEIVFYQPFFKHDSRHTKAIPSTAAYQDIPRDDIEKSYYANREVFIEQHPDDINQPKGRIYRG